MMFRQTLNGLIRTLRRKRMAGAAARMKAIECSVDGIAILDAEGKYSYVNRAHAACYGYDKPEEMLGIEWASLYTPKTSVKFRAETFPVLDKFGEWSGQSEGRRRDGKTFPQEVSLRKLDNGGMICIVRDISEKIRSDNLLRTIRLAVEAASDGIAITDPENRILFANQSFLKIHGCNPHEQERYNGTDWRLLYNEVGREQINAVVLPTAILKGAWSGSIPVVRQDGSLFYGDASLTRLPDGTMLGVMRDVTERHMVEAEREKLRHGLFQSQKVEAIGRITTRLVKDFQALLDLVARVPDSDGGNLMQEMRVAARKAQESVDEILSFSEPKKARAKAMKLPEFLRFLEPDLIEILPKNISLTVDIRSDDLWGMFDEKQMRQSVINICLNAADALSGMQGRIVITAKSISRNLFGLRNQMIVGSVPDRNSASEVRTKFMSNGRGYVMSGYLVRDKNYAELVVSDTGGGIPRDILPNIFDPFFTTKAKGEGGGLGLSTAQGFVAGFGGAIIIETMQNSGTGVHLFVPVPDRTEDGGFAFHLTKNET